MAKRKHIKPYAVELVKAFRQDAKTITSRVPTAMDLADVIAVKPQIIISPQNAQVEYDEEYLVFQIDPDSLEVDDVVVIGRDPSGQPIVLGKADWSNPDPMLDPDIIKLNKAFKKLQKNSKHLKPTVKSLKDLPLDGNGDGDLRVVRDDDSIQLWDGNTNRWVPAVSSAPTPTRTVNTNYAMTKANSTVLVDTSGGPLTITLPANHVNGKVYYIKDKTGNAAANNITIATADADLIDGAGTVVLNVNRQVLSVVSDGSNWFVLGIWP